MLWDNLEGQVAEQGGGGEEKWVVRRRLKQKYMC